MLKRVLRWLDVLFPLVMILFMMSLAEWATQDGPHPQRVSGTVVAILAGGALYWRRTNPGWAMLVCAGASAVYQILAPEGLFPYAALVALWALTARRPVYWSLPALAAVIGVTLLAIPSDLFPREDLDFAVIVAVVVWALSWAMRSHRLAIQQAAARIAMEDQSRLARDIHDVIAHSVSVIVVQAAAADDVFDSRPDRAREALRSIEATGRDALTELRTLLAASPSGDNRPGASGAGRLSAASEPGAAIAGGSGRGIASMPAFDKPERGVPANAASRGSQRAVPAAPASDVSEGNGPPVSPSHGSERGVAVASSFLRSERGIPTTSTPGASAAHGHEPAPLAAQLVDNRPWRHRRPQFRKLLDTAVGLARARVGARESAADQQSPLTPQPTLDRLRPDIIAPLEAAGLDVEFVVDGETAGLARGIQLTAFRIVQESLTNVLRHGRGAGARVWLHVGERELEIVVENVCSDAGVPRRVGIPGAGRGIVGMRERAALVGGVLEAGPTAEDGFRVVGRLPMTGAVRL